MRRSSHFAAVTASGVAGVAIALVLGYYASKAANYSSLIDVVIEGDLPIEKDAEMGFAPTRNGSTRRTHPRVRRSFHIFTDDRGGRVGSPSPPRRQSVAIMALGCSFTWGHLLENEQAYPQILSDRLGVPVENLAFGSFGTVQALQMLRRNVDLRPELVIYGFIDDHLRRNLTGCALSYAPLCLPMAYVTLTEDNRPVLSPPPPGDFDLNRQFFLEFLASDRRLSFGKVIMAARADWARPLVSRARDDPEARQKALGLLLHEMRSTTRSIGARLLVAYIPNPGRSATRPPSEQLTSVLREMAADDVVYVDLAPAFLRWYSDDTKESLQIEGDGHPNARAHELIAGEIERVVREKRLVTGVF